MGLSPGDEYHSHWMSTVSPGVRPSIIPPLQPGDRLTRAEFERRYDATPGLVKAELIEGIVYMPPPVSDDHSSPHSYLCTVLGIYCFATPGVRSGDNGSIRMDLDNMPQPDLFLRIDSACGGQTHISADRYVEGAPELIAEIAVSSASYDLHAKLNAYRRNGVKEYIVWRTLERGFDYFVLREGKYERLAAGADGVYRSEVFPGLWIAADALLTGDLSRVQRALQEGIATQEHAAFVQKLQDAAKSSHR
jgi:Uma2 family endonuclease